MSNFFCCPIRIQISFFKCQFSTVNCQLQLLFLNSTHYVGNRACNAERRTLYAQVVIVRRAPMCVCIVIVMVCASLIYAHNLVVSLLTLVLELFHNPATGKRHRSRYKHMEAVRAISQNPVGTTTNDYARTLLRHTSSGTADPRTPASWCRHTPFTFIFFPYYLIIIS